MVPFPSHWVIHSSKSGIKFLNLTYSNPCNRQSVPLGVHTPTHLSLKPEDVSHCGLGKLKCLHSYVRPRALQTVPMALRPPPCF